MKTKIKLKQRWIYHSEGQDNTLNSWNIIAEVCQHSNGSKYATLKTKQILKKGYSYCSGAALGAIWWNQRLEESSFWSLLPNQQRS